MSKARKNRTPVSADGITLRRGSKVFCLRTTDGAKSWFIVEKTVENTTRRGMVTFQKKGDPARTWSYCWPLKEMVGDHRIYSDEASAVKEMEKRNRKGEQS